MSVSIARPHLTEQQIEYLRAVETDDERRAAEEAARAQAEAEYQNSIDGRLEPFRIGDPPADLRVNVRGLTPAHARYVCHVAWVEAARAEVHRLEQARDRLLTALGAPAVHQAELDSLKDNDRSGFIAWVLSGALGDRHAVDNFRRQRIEAELQAATAEADAARAGLAAFDDALLVARRAVEVLQERRHGYARAALREMAEPVLAAYDAQVEQFRSTIANLAGLRMATAGTQVGPLPEYDVRLPHLGDGPARVTVSAAEIEKAAKPWREALARLLENPHDVKVEKA